MWWYDDDDNDDDDWCYVGGNQLPSADYRSRGRFSCHAAFSLHDIQHDCHCWSLGSSQSQIRFTVHEASLRSLVMTFSLTLFLDCCRIYCTVDRPVDRNDHCDLSAFGWNPLAFLSPLQCLLLVPLPLISRRRILRHTELERLWKWQQNTSGTSMKEKREMEKMEERWKRGRDVVVIDSRK